MMASFACPVNVVKLYVPTSIPWDRRSSRAPFTKNSGYSGASYLAYIAYPPFLLPLLLPFLRTKCKTTRQAAGRVAVIGAGPAGLASAVALRKDFGSKVDVTVYERSAELRFAGWLGHSGHMTWYFSFLDVCQCLVEAWCGRWSAATFGSRIASRSWSGLELCPSDAADQEQGCGWFWTP